MARRVDLSSEPDSGLRYATVKLATRVKGPPAIEVSVTNPDFETAERIAKDLFDRLRDYYGVGSDDESEI